MVQSDDDFITIIWDEDEDTWHEISKYNKPHPLPIDDIFEPDTVFFNEDSTEGMILQTIYLEFD